MRAKSSSTLQSLTAAIEPVMIVFLGVCVGFIVIAMLGTASAGYIEPVRWWQR